MPLLVACKRHESKHLLTTAITPAPSRAGRWEDSICRFLKNIHESINGFEGKSPHSQMCKLRLSVRKRVARRLGDKDAAVLRPKSLSQPPCREIPEAAPRARHPGAPRHLPPGRGAGHSGKCSPARFSGAAPATSAFGCVPKLWEKGARRRGMREGSTLGLALRLFPGPSRQWGPGTLGRASSTKEDKGRGCLGYCCGREGINLALRSGGSGIEDVGSSLLSVTSSLYDPAYIQYLRLSGLHGFLPVKLR